MFGRSERLFGPVVAATPCLRAAGADASPRRPDLSAAQVCLDCRQVVLHTHTHTDCRFRRQCEVTPGVVDVDLLTGTSRVHAVFLLAMLTWCAAAGSSSTCSLRRFEIHFFHINNKWKRCDHSFLFIKKKNQAQTPPDMRAAIFEPESLQWIR